MPPRRISTSLGLATTAVLLAAGVVSASNVAPKPPGPAGPAEFVGAPATAQPVHGIPTTAKNPYLVNDAGYAHNDSWNSDTYRGAGPLGRNPVMRSADFRGDCIGQSFDSRGRIIAICVDPLGVGPKLFMFDPHTLETLATFDLPPRQTPPPGINPLRDTGGGIYFFVDKHDRVWNGTTTSHIQSIQITETGFELERDYDLTHVLRPEERITAEMFDWSGKLWFTTRINGVVGLLDPETGQVNVLRLGNGLEGSVQNGLAVDKDGAYVATNRKQYRLKIGPNMTPEIVWEDGYDAVKGLIKPGQIDDGTGTSPTILPGGYTAIADNAEHMKVVVYRNKEHLKKGESRKVCEVPVFNKGTGSTENSIIGAGRSLIVENNYGYDLLEFMQNPSAVSEPGMTRIDIDKDGKGCHVVWTSNERIPSVVSKLSLATGLIYTYTNDPAPGTDDPWYWTAIDYRTGETKFKVLAGNGSQWNNHYAAIDIGPDGTAYTSGFPGGLWSLRDGE